MPGLRSEGGLAGLDAEQEHNGRGEVVGRTGTVNWPEDDPGHDRPTG